MTNLVLVVEDEDVARSQLRDLLEQGGYRVVEAGDGEQALSLYSQIQPDIVLLDLVLPGMDGITCCTQIQKLPGSTNTPVLMMTGLYDQTSVERAFAAGASDYITKPIQWQVLHHRVRRLLEARSTMEELRKQNEQVQSYANTQAVVAELSQLALSGIDLTMLMQETVALVTQYLNVENTKVLELLPDGNSLLLRAGIGWQQGLVGCATVDAGRNSPAGYTLLSHEPVAVSDLRTETRFRESTLLHEHQVVAGISVVIHGKERPFGVLGAYTKQARTFSTDEIYFLQAVANVLATAIERQKVEDALRESEERFQIVARATNNVIWDWDLLTNQVWWNESVYKLFAYSPQEVGSNVNWWFGHIHSDDRQRIVSDIHAVISSGQEFWSNEYRFLRNDGTYAYIFERGYVVHDHRGTPVRMIGAMMDISERKRVQEELQRQNLRSKLFADITLKIRQSLQIDEILQTSVKEVQNLLHADRVLIFRLHPDGSGVVVKEAVVPSFPLILGQSIYDPCFAEHYLVKYRQGRISAITNVDQANIELCHKQFLQQFSVKANLIVPILYTDQLWGLLIAHQCRYPRQWTSWETELLRQLADQIAIALAQARMLEQETRQRQELAVSNEELQQFAFIASHDLQEPLRKIKTFGDRLKATCGDSLTEQAQDYLERMQNAVRRMQALIEDLLTLSRVTTRAQPFMSVNLNQVTQEVISDLEVLIQQTKGSVEVSDLPTIKADPLQMHQLLQNLIGNALKFHRKEVRPIVKIYSQVAKVVDGAELCQIIVEDNGIGFDEKYLERIFSVFQRLHGRTEYEGTGIGLAICRKITERHHGSITARSQPGEGTSFIVTLPINSFS
ncbi:GAF domain-containing protein [Aetokthonos hydrillicola Thurmond2011]|jgi:PAS domain S-box-containing protein|uniref:histidine kinase n=1 Tax=Aetokthonos hydrillicola Thurmond2011 TaxID=2712845 RepID=A0AAP5I5U3_9CYAN|nr:GAF domain-containing protein [Aetokthonos hydrillicola]MBO3463313.1 GAF domain-containing protein [Aetokthonos hydrillicola CCALA 1050]MBW4584814.1 GAF domain-containing protein [Aetokthonos hydrillicola CCALA 1050]MDR9895361.1 GAF domain-containing protein [Aetokthonos hydrillicola Thurmond2011]